MKKTNHNERTLEKCVARGTRYVVSIKMRISLCVSTQNKSIIMYVPDKKWYYCRCKQHSLFSCVPCRRTGQHLWRSAFYLRRARICPCSCSWICAPEVADSTVDLRNNERQLNFLLELRTARRKNKTMEIHLECDQCKPCDRSVDLNLISLTYRNNWIVV